LKGFSKVSLAVQPHGPGHTWNTHVQPPPSPESSPRAASSRAPPRASPAQAALCERSHIAAAWGLSTGPGAAVRARSDGACGSHDACLRRFSPSPGAAVIGCAPEPSHGLAPGVSVEQLEAEGGTVDAHESGHESGPARRTRR
jgi:hypothetical protein